MFTTKPEITWNQQRFTVWRFHYKFESQTKLVKRFLKVHEPFSQALASSQAKPELIYSFAWK